MRRVFINGCAAAGILALTVSPICAAEGELVPPRTSPIKLAVFDFELADFSAGGPIAGESPAETARLKVITEEAKRLLEKSGQYVVVDASSVDSEQAKTHWLRNCNGCEADFAAKLGADQSLLGIMQKLSVLVHTLRFEIRDTRTGKLLWNIQTDLRGDTDESWRRSVRYLLEQRLFASHEDNKKSSQMRKP